MISCRKCGRVCMRGNSGLCTDCKAEYRASGHGSAEYLNNARKVRNYVDMLMRIDVPVKCGICRMQIMKNSAYQIDHIIRLRDGGGNNIENLRPTHSHCNASDR